MKKVINKIRKIIFKIKDYDRLEKDYITVICHATMSTLSKPNYDVNAVMRVIDDSQQDFFYDFFKSELSTMIESGSTIEDIKKYIYQL